MRSCRQAERPTTSLVRQPVRPELFIPWSVVEAGLTANPFAMEERLAVFRDAGRDVIGRIPW